MRNAAADDGMTLVEVMAALALLLVLMAGLMSVSSMALKLTENQGNLAARTTEYAQDKMEQLMALAYGDLNSDTRTFPAPNSGGSGLAVGGSYNVDAPTALYVDYLDANGNLCGSTGASCVAPSGTTPPDGWFFKRAWQIDDSTSDATLPANLKRITVASATSRGFGGTTRSTSYLTVLKTSPF